MKNKKSLWKRLFSQPKRIIELEPGHAAIIIQKPGDLDEIRTGLLEASQWTGYNYTLPLEKSQIIIN